MRPLLFLLITACANREPPEPVEGVDSASELEDPIQPNLLIFVADDMGIDKLARYEFHPTTPSTPIIDGMMDGGVRFTRAWAQPVCSPARSSLMTGLRPVDTLIGGALGRVNSAPLADETTTMPEVLTGYSSSLIGKWHLSSQSLGGGGFRTHPTDSGFGWYAGLIHGMDKEVAFDGQPQNYFSWERTENGTPTRDERYITTANADDAIDRIEAMPEPWLLVVTFYAPHGPHQVAPAHLQTGVEKGSTDDERKYNSAIEAMDTEMGRVIASMEAEVAERTTVIFTTDNGTPQGVVSAPAERTKGTLFEGGIRVPMVATGYGVTRPGEDCVNLVQISDIFATAADLAGVPADSGTDSISFAPCLSDAAAAGREIATAQRFKPSGPAPYSVYGATARDDRYKLIVTSESSPAFFDLGHEPTEGEDLLSGSLNADEQAAYDALWAVIPDELRP